MLTNISGNKYFKQNQIFNIWILDTTTCNLTIYNFYKVDLLCVSKIQNSYEKYSIQSRNNQRTARDSRV